MSKMSRVCLHHSARLGFTLLELLVVVITVALLISIMLPSLVQARKQAKMLRCLANLREIAGASIAYANSEPSEELVPRVNPSLESHHAMSIVWGGKGGRPSAFTAVGGAAKRLTQLYTQVGYKNVSNGPGARLLNKFLYPSVSDARDEDIRSAIDKDNKLDLSIFHCPSDVGISSLHDGSTFVAVSSDTNRRLPTLALLEESPFYDAFGNSYRAQVWLELLIISYEDLVDRRYTFSAARRPYSQIPNPSRTVVYSEGNAFFTHLWNRWWNAAYAIDLSEYWARGWHGQKQVFNASFADGHVAVMDQKVRMRPPIGVSSDGYGYEYADVWMVAGSRPEFIKGMPILDAFELQDYIFRGDAWQLDAWPAPPVLLEDH